jgi:cytochrome c oxidase subunit 4
MTEHSTPAPSIYVKTFLALMILTFVTVWTAKYVNLGQGNVVLAIVIASTKAGLVIAYFMNLINASKTTKIWASIGIFFLMIMFLLTLTDFRSRGGFDVEGFDAKGARKAAPTGH